MQGRPTTKVGLWNKKSEGQNSRSYHDFIFMFFHKLLDQKDFRLIKKYIIFLAPPFKKFRFFFIPLFFSHFSTKVLSHKLSNKNKFNFKNVLLISSFQMQQTTQFLRPQPLSSSIYKKMTLVSKSSPCSRTC